MYARTTTRRGLRHLGLGRKRALGALLLTAAVGAIAPAAQADAAFEIKPRFTYAYDMCLDVPFSDQSDGRGLINWGCNSQLNQRFDFESTGDGYYRIRALHSGKCLQVRGASLADGANIEQWTCLSGTTTPQERSQQFSLTVLGNWYRIVARNGKCVDIAGANPSEGTKVQQWSCGGGHNAQFALLWR